MTRLLQVAHFALILAVIAFLALTAWGAYGLNQHTITLIDDADYALKHPVDAQTSASMRETLASVQAFIQDAADEMHSIAHPSKGQKILNDAAKFVPHIF
jgi:preprotein translocase subunit SecE